MDIILYLLRYIQYQQQIIRYLFNFICRYIPLKQWIYDDSHSPKYQKFKIDELPKILHYEPWDYRIHTFILDNARCVQLLLLEAIHNERYPEYQIENDIEVVVIDCRRHFCIVCRSSVDLEYSWIGARPKITQSPTDSTTPIIPSR